MTATEELREDQDIDATNRSPDVDDDNDTRRPGIVGPAPEKAARTLEVARGLASRMGLDADITVRDEEEHIIVVIAEKEGATSVQDMLGSARPPVVPSFQFLLNKIVNRFPHDRKHVLVEVPSLPKRAPAPRRQPKPHDATPRRSEESEVEPDVDPSLARLGRLLAERARSIGKVITVHPMLPGDRRAIHQTIMRIEGVNTVSEGDGLYRRMHVVPESIQPRGGGRRRRHRRGGRHGGGEGRRGEGRPAQGASPEGPATDPDAFLP